MEGAAMQGAGKGRRLDGKNAARVPGESRLQRGLILREDEIGLRKARQQFAAKRRRIFMKDQDRFRQV